MLRYFLICLFVSKTVCSASQKQKLELIEAPDAVNIIAAYYGFDKGGNTSVAFDMDDSYKWSGESTYRKDGFGYFNAEGKEIPYIKRDRDIGQTFSIEGANPVKIRSLTVRLGFGSNVVRPGMYGRKVSVQFFEVSGSAELHNNGTVGSTEAYHGFPHDRVNSEIPAERDDYISGEQFRQVAIYGDFIFPEAREFGSADNSPLTPDHENLKGRYLNFTFSDGIMLHPGKQYAFLILINEKGEDHGFTLANNYTGSYRGGHAIRRDGSGTFPPVPADPAIHFRAPGNRKAYESAHFPSNLKKRLAIQPSTNGYPDVDTWRDLWFILEGSQ